MSRSRPSVDQCHTQPKQPAPIALAFKANRSALQRPEVLKGQLILKWIYEVIVSPETLTKNCHDYCPHYSKLPKQPAPIALAFKANRSALQCPEVLFMTLL